MKSNYGEGKHMDKCAIKDIAERDNPFEDFPEGFYFKAKAQKQPLIVTSKKGETQVEQDFNVDGEQIEGEQVYSGCVANVSVEIWFSQKYKVLGVNLLAIKYVGEGKAFEYVNPCSVYFTQIQFNTHLSFSLFSLLREAARPVVITRSECDRLTIKSGQDH